MSRWLDRNVFPQSRNVCYRLPQSEGLVQEQLRAFVARFSKPERHFDWFRKPVYDAVLGQVLSTERDGELEPHTGENDRTAHSLCGFCLRARPFRLLRAPQNPLSLAPNRTDTPLSSWSWPKAFLADVLSSSP